MKTALIYPSRKSEKAISRYSKDLLKGLKNNKINVSGLTYDSKKPSTFFKLFKKFKNYDVIHIQHEYNLLGHYGIPFLLTYVRLLFRKCKVITTMHTVTPANFSFVRNTFYKVANRLINLSSDSIFVHSPYQSEILKNVYKIQKSRVLPHGVTENFKIFPKKEAKKDLKLKGKIYLIIGNIHEGHGIHDFLKKADKIKGNIVIRANDGPINNSGNKKRKEYLNYLKRMVKNRNLKNVKFVIKPLDDESEEWDKYFSAADFLVQFYKGYIISGIFAQAMAYRTPVISSNIPYFKDIKNKYGCLTIAKKNLSETLEEVLKPKNYKKISDECERYYKENNWTEVSKKYKKIYEEVLAGI